MSFFQKLFSHSRKPSEISASDVSDTDFQAPPTAPLPEEGEAIPQTGLLMQNIHPAAWQIADCIESEFASPKLSAQGFAQALNMNPAYLGRIFRASYHMSISDYINRTRIHHSLFYLEDTDMPIEEVARAVGFENTKYFFVLFKNIMKTTPRQYRINCRHKPHT